MIKKYKLVWWTVLLCAGVAFFFLGCGSNVVEDQFTKDFGGSIEFKNCIPPGQTSEIFSQDDEIFLREGTRQIQLHPTRTQDDIGNISYFESNFFSLLKRHNGDIQYRYYSHSCYINHSDVI